jgi:hypothetical protein
MNNLINEAVEIFLTLIGEKTINVDYTCENKKLMISAKMKEEIYFPYLDKNIPIDNPFWGEIIFSPLLKLNIPIDNSFWEKIAIEHQTENLNWETLTPVEVYEKKLSNCIGFFN